MGLAIGTVLQSIFLDVLLVISAPLARKLAPKIGKLGTARMATAMAIALECGIVFTVPGVASLALAGLLNVPLGKMLLFGLLLVIPTIVISIAIMTFLFRRGFWNEEKDEDHTFVAEEDREGEEEEPDGGAAPAPLHPATRRAPAALGHNCPPARTVTVAERERKQFPLMVLFAPLLTSLLLIGAGAILQILKIDMPWLQLLGEPVIALLIGLIGTCLVTRSAIGQKRVEEAIAVGFKESGQILILTGVGGSLAATVAAAGLGDILGGFFSASTVAPLLVVWAHRGCAAHRRRLRHAFRHHRRGAAGPHRPGHRPGPCAAGPGGRRRIALHGPCHQQHLLAAAVTCWARACGVR